MRRVSTGGAAFLAAIGVLLLSASASSQGRRDGAREVETINNREAVAREVLVKFQDPRPRAQLAQILSSMDPEDIELVGRSGVFRVRSRSLNATALLAALANRGDIVYAEPNFVVRALTEPNDILFPQLWGLRTVKSTESWDISLGSAGNVVAVVDTGIDYTHEDLTSNIWSATAPFTVTIGGVSITCPAGSHGFNAIQRNCNPMDDHNHGTHVSGTIGAAGNNAIGVVGVNWIASVMGLKFLDASGSGTVADAIDAIDFAIQAKQAFASTGGANIRVLSNSWGGGNFSQAMLDQIIAANSHDMLFVAAAGNSGISNDFLPMYPASYNAPNVVAVAATTNTDARAYFSNYGAQSVHLGAPGVDILSTIRGDAYGSFSGTSMATPHVSGAAALVLSRCLLDTAQLKQTLLESVDLVSSLGSTTITGGRLNVNRALQSCVAPPAIPANLSAIGGDTKVRLAWSEAAGATSYRVKRSVTSGGPYDLVASNVKALQYVDGGLTNGTTYYYVVSAANVLGESGDSAEASATPKLPADLVISSFNAPGETGAGSQLVASIATRNQGTGTADPSTTRFYISINTVVEPGDVLLDQAQAVSTLAPGATAAASVSLSIPSDLTPRQYYLIAKADADDVLFENQEGNNTSLRFLYVGADLVVSTLTVPTNATAGAMIVANYTVQNQGGGSAAASSLRFYWSTNSTLDTGDPLLGSQDIAALAPDGTASGQSTLTIPSGLGMGTYYVIAEADAMKAIPELWETNNTAARAVQIGADLLISSFTVPAKGGSLISVTDTTTNQGSEGVGSSMTRFYLSTNSVWDASDTLLQGSHAVPALGPGASDSASTTVTIPATTVPGTYYLIAKTDADNAIAETQESNNTLARSIQIGGDLVISAFTTPLKVGAGVPFVVSETTKNQGGGNIGASLTYFYLSTDALLTAGDTLLNGSRPVAALAAGEISAGSTTLTIPSGVSPGWYYLFAKADGGNGVTETQESNNSSIKGVYIGPDLVVSIASATSPVQAGTLALVSDTVTNKGAGDAGASVVRYYLSTDYFLGANDVALAESRPVPALPAGASSSGSTSVTIPAGTAPGNYYIFAKADADGSVPESSETNNAAPRGIRVE